MLKKFITPYFLFFYCAALAALAVAVPPTLYKKFIDEKYYAFGDGVLFLWVVSCLSFFVLGGVFSKLVPQTKCLFAPSVSKKKITFICLCPLFFGIMFLVTFVSDNKDVMWLYFLGEGTEYKNQLVTNFYYFSIYMLMGLSCWLLSLTLRYGGRLLCFLFLIAFIEVFLAGVLMLARFLIVPYLISLLIVYLRYRSPSCKLFVFFGLLFLGVLVFSSFLRVEGKGGVVEPLLSQIFGYVFASFNRLSLVLDGELQYTYADTGYYLAPFLTHIPLLHAVIGNPIGVEYQQVWSSEFSDVASAGLVRNYIWSTLFGYIYSGIREGALLYFFLYGFVVFVSWRSFLKERVLGVVFYPWFYSCIFLSFSSNMAFLPQFFGFVYIFGYIFVVSAVYDLISQCFGGHGKGRPQSSSANTI